jgi:3-hydroxyacyl-[acyl-carrier-protein] dehydratase
MRLEYFEMIDAILTVDRAARSLVARSRTPDTSPVFDGHFPGNPLVPGVLLTETIAQAGGHLLMALNDVTRMPFLAGVERAKFRQFVGPGTDLEVSATLVHEGSGYAVTKGAISAGGKPVCEAELMYRLLPFPGDMASMMRARIATITAPDAIRA